MAATVKRAAITTWEGIWYVLMCAAFAYGYFAKVPTKKALQDFGLVEMTSAERFWYVLMCIWFGAGYFAKIPVAKALSELPQFRSERRDSLQVLAQAQVPPAWPAPPSLQPPLPTPPAGDVGQSP